MMPARACRLSTLPMQIVAALQSSRRLGDTRNRNAGSRQDRESGGLDLAGVGRKVDGTGVHSLGHRLVNEVDDEYAGLADMLERVLRRAIRRDCKPRTTSAGSSLNTLKKENGAALTTPSLPTVVTRAIGRGTTSAASSL